mmetsp:Transcript_1139/g.4817  ORF Transcript_1139/g.4817 Transcript_1139/m.4817 type:complete len:212 (-) Transcript_1139:3511-4146(-)
MPMTPTPGAVKKMTRRMTKTTTATTTPWRGRTSTRTRTTRTTRWTRCTIRTTPSRSTRPTFGQNVSERSRSSSRLPRVKQCAVRVLQLMTTSLVSSLARSGSWTWKRWSSCGSDPCPPPRSKPSRGTSSHSKLSTMVASLEWSFSSAGGSTAPAGGNAFRIQARRSPLKRFARRSTRRRCGPWKATVSRKPLRRLVRVSPRVIEASLRQAM